MSQPDVKRDHDINLYENSDMDDILLDGLFIYRRQFDLYGDPAYMLRSRLQIGFNSALKMVQKLTMNAAMSSTKQLNGHSKI